MRVGGFKVVLRVGGGEEDCFAYHYLFKLLEILWVCTAGLRRMCERTEQGGAVCSVQCAPSIRKMRFSDAYRNKNCNGYICVTVPRNSISIRICVNFEKFRRHPAGVKVDGVEERGEREAMSGRWSTSSDYRRMFRFF